MWIVYPLNFVHYWVNFYSTPHNFGFIVEINCNKRAEINKEKLSVKRKKILLWRAVAAALFTSQK